MSELIYGCPECRKSFDDVSITRHFHADVSIYVSLSSTSGKMDDEGLDTPEFSGITGDHFSCGGCGAAFTDAAVVAGDEG